MKRKVKDATYYLIKRLGRAAFNGGMLQDGEPVVVALSGGVCSSGLLFGLVARNRRLPIRNEFIPVHVPDGSHGDPSQVRQGLEELCRSLNLSLRVRSSVQSSPDDPALERNPASAPHLEALLQACVEENAPVLALGHTAEDLALELLVSMGIRGEVRPILPVESVQTALGNVRIVRPLWLLMEGSVQRMVQEESLFFAPRTCPLPYHEFREECLEFIRSRKINPLETLRNITLSPEHIAWDYLV